jgi:peptidyl-prolyl cis-trans isomerase SurA
MLAWMALFAAILLGTPRAVVRAQEGEPVVIDAVIAQVNNDVIMLSMLRREMRDAIEAFKQQGVAEQKATEEVTRRQPEIIASLVNEQLLLQKGKEMNLTDEVEAEVNKEMLRVAGQQGIKSVAELDEELRKAGLDPAQIRQTLRTQFMKNAVLSREVDAKIFYGVSAEEVKRYYDAHLDMFRKPEVVVLSEIFLSLAGKPEAEVRAKATQILSQLRAGADFATLAAANSDREQNGVRIATQNKGKVGTFQLPDLKPEFAAAIKNVPVGGTSEILRTDEGFEILRVDERTAASATANYNEDRVREAITVERREKERDAYMKGLRRDAYIKIAKDYQATVGPLLTTDAAAPGTTNTGAAAARNSTGNNSKPDASKKP